MSDLLKELQEAHRESPSWRLFGLCHQAATHITALEAQLAERGKTEREIEYDVYSKIRRAFRRALSELPEIAPPEISRVLSSVHMRDEFLNEGKRLQRTHGTDAVAPRVEQECGAGAWLFMRNGILSALEATPPAPKVTEVLVEALEGSITAIDDWLHIYAPDECNPDRVAEARRRISAGGTLWYIAITQERNRAALQAIEVEK